MTTRPASLVSGAASGIGRHMARALHRAGHRLLLVDIDDAGLARTVREHGLEGDACVVCSAFDVRDAKSWAAAAELALTRFGQIDYALNIAGFLQPGYVHESSADELARQLDVNAKGVVLATHAIAPHMVRQRRGHIVNVASLAGLSHVPGLAAYCASKHAVRGFSLAVSHELAPHGVHVSVLCPDAVETPMLTLQESYPEAAMVFGGGRGLTLDEVEAAFFRIFRDKPLELVLDVPGTGRAVAAKAANLMPSLTRRFAPFVARKGRAVQDRRRS